jgi:KaiC/GvpD/RAD55 family RecA-like ATPase
MYDGLYQFKQQDAYNFADHVHIQARTKGDELLFKVCPYCKGKSSGKNDEKTFSINLNTGQFKCFRASCGMTGNMITLAKDFDFSLGTDFDSYLIKPKRKTFKKPAEKIVPKPPAIQYLQSRGISETVAIKYEITTQTERDNILVFPFYDTDGELNFIKYRKTDFDKEKDKCKEWCQPNGTPILFGMKQCNLENKTLIITEGQLDSLSVAEAGFENAVSVPTGAKGFTWVPNCWDFVSKFEEIIVFGDHEKGQITLLEEIDKRFHKLKIRHVREEDYLDCKDANDILRKYGRDQIKKCIEQAITVPVRHVIELADVQDVNPFEFEKLKTGFRGLDQLLYGGLPFGGLIIMTGKSGLGKSTFASQVLLNAMESNHKVFAYSGELPNSLFKSWIVYQAAGTKHVIEYDTKWGSKGFSVSDTNKQLISEWFRGKIKLYDENSITEEETVSLLKLTEEMIIKEGCDVILMDNLMTAIDIVDAKEKDKYEQQSKFVKSMARMAKSYGVLIILVAHMRKNNYGGGNGNDEVLGSSDITNLGSITLMIDNEKDSDNRVLKCWKNRLFGKTNTTGWPIQYDEKSKRIYEVLADLDKTYSWEHGSQDGWMQIDEDPFQ